jgi:hypothetical protein
MSELPNPVKRSIEKTVADWTTLTDAVKTINLEWLRQNLKGEKELELSRTASSHVTTGTYLRGSTPQVSVPIPHTAQPSRRRRQPEVHM